MAGKEVCLVTGGRGFAARQLVQKLVQSERWIVRIMDLAPTVRLSDEELLSPLGNALLDGQAEYVSADLRNKEQVFEACKGVTVVFHMAAPDTSNNNFKLHYDVTVTGTRNIIDACVHHKVRKLIYTSSPSVVFDGLHGIYNADESVPYPDKHNDFYSETKAQAEVLVLKANGKGGLLTCAIRPSGIFGPGDRLLLPSLVNAAKSGKLKFIIGDGENLFDFTYVENVAHAHICAEQALNHGAKEDESNASGKAYFITNREPIKFWDFTGEIVERLGYKRPTVHLPVTVVMPLAYLAEWVFKQLAPLGVPITQFTPSRVRYITCWRSFNCARAEKYLNYTPPISLEEGINRTVEAFWDLRAEVQNSQSREFHLQSKVHSHFGGGKLADFLLWRNAKQSVAVLLSMFCACYLFFQSGYTLMFILARTVLLLVVLLFTYSYLPQSVLDRKLPEIPSALFEIPEEKVYAVVSSVGAFWNDAVSSLQLLVKERNWSLFFRVLLILRFMKFLGTFSMQGFIYFGIIILFTFPYIYEQYEQEIVESIKQVGVALDGYRKVALSKLPSSVKSRLHQE
ncbi:hypothetical protein O6H91_23G032900 [Diphasiastrum complanatum]|uniref:Uncharacterized protein n=1 Tax=Diphasiastrum complanatum TaxID=34168 RepID=A0ACC2A9D0_DIPCM|nr:hypothetical protein O6H91_23G032900 [Diphasiastrum complanatum]